MRSSRITVLVAAVLMGLVSGAQPATPPAEPPAQRDSAWPLRVDAPGGGVIEVYQPQA